MKIFIRSIKKHLIQSENGELEGTSMHQFYDDVSPLKEKGVMNNLPKDHHTLFG